MEFWAARPFQTNANALPMDNAIFNGRTKISRTKISSASFNKPFSSLPCFVALTPALTSTEGAAVASLQIRNLATMLKLGQQPPLRVSHHAVPAMDDHAPSCDAAPAFMRHSGMLNDVPLQFYRRQPGVAECPATEFPATELPATETFLPESQSANKPKTPVSEVCRSHLSEPAIATVQSCRPAACSPLRGVEVRVLFANARAA